MAGQDITKVSKGTQFSSNNQPKNNGRKPSRLKKYLKETNMSSQDYALIFENIIGKYSFNEIKIMVKTGKDQKGKDLTALVWGFCMAFIADCKRGLSAGGIYAQITERKYGKAVQPIEADVNLTAAAISPAERDEAFKEAMKEALKKDPALLEELTGGNND